MNVSVEIPALEDIERARAWYAAREVDAQDDLSARFEEAVAEAVMRVREAPASYAIVYRNARRIRLRTFPYNLYYRYLPERNVVVIVACTHAKQQASAWRSRF